MILKNRPLSAVEVVRSLGLRFRDYRMRMRMTRKEVSVAAGVGMTTLYKFETGNLTDLSFSTLYRLMRAIGIGENWESILPELPESPYLYNDRYQKIQRIRHSSKKQ